MSFRAAAVRCSAESSELRARRTILLPAPAGRDPRNYLRESWGSGAPTADKDVGVSPHQSGRRRKHCSRPAVLKQEADYGARLYYRRSARSRSAFPITDRELRLIAPAATMGLSSRPDTGNRTPAASGTPTTL